MNNVMMPKIAGLVEEMTGLRFRNKRASSHGWSGGAVDRLSTRLQDAGFEMSLSLKAKWRPDLDALELCREHGREIARQWALSPRRSPQHRAGRNRKTALVPPRGSRSRPVDAVQRLPVGLRSGDRRAEPGCPAGDAVERGPG